MARLSTGSTLGFYEILAPLGAGGMGEVYHARDSRLGRAVAIKVLPEAVAAHADRLARFEREAKTVAALNHPHIVTIHSIEEADGVRFLTMELVDGETLDRVVPAGGLALPRALELAVALADALAAAHERGIVHRDLKPANVMVTREGRLKVLDFGLAKLSEGATSADGPAQTMESPISTAGQVVGTVPYMSPEQVRGEAVDARADLFSFGILLYELVSGRRPFAGKTWADVSSSILRDAPPPLLAVRGDLPRDLERVVARCLEKDRERRFQTAKDVRNELELVRSGLGPGVASSVERPVPAPAPKELPSIAVLPFANRSASADDEYFSDGLADELLNVLAKIKGLRVAARTSSATFKGKAVAIGEVGAALKVATVLEGSVRKSGNRVRIAVQLVQVADGYPLWSETYDRTLDDIFAVQDDIAQSVVKELRVALLGEAPDSDASREVKAEVAAAAQGRGTNIEAHRLYMQGRHLSSRVNPEDNAKAIDYLEQALALEPTLAPAWAALAMAHAYAGGYGFVDIAEGYEAARAAAHRAIELDPNLAEAYVSLSRIQVAYDWDWAAALASVNRALELAPDNADVLSAAAGRALYLGDVEEALGYAVRMVERDPLSSTNYGQLGSIYRTIDRHAEAEKAFRHAIELAPRRIGVRLLLGLTLKEQGRLDEAMAIVQEEPATWARLTGLAAFHHAAGRQAESDTALAELIADHAKDSAYQIAAAYALRGEPDKMFEWLERGIRERDSGLMYARREPVFRPYRDDPRWAEFQRKMGYSDEGG